MAKVLIVEDDKILSNMYRVKFTNAGHQVALAENGEEGIAKMKAMHPDLVLMDLMMPVMDGFTAIMRIQEDPTLKTVPVIVLTNLSMSEDAKKAIEMGAKDYFVKSDLTPAQVLEKAQKFLPPGSS